MNIVTMPTTCKRVNLSVAKLSECLLVEEDNLDEEISAGGKTTVLNYRTGHQQYVRCS